MARTTRLEFTPPAGRAEFTGALEVGAAAVEITPPTAWAIGLAGNGSEGRRATHVRAPLLARALVVRGTNGEIAVLVTADIAAPSLVLREAVVRSARARLPGLASQHLTLFATHTHTGPSHIFDAAIHNRNISSVPGYDDRVLNHIAVRIADAVVNAMAALVPARVSWDSLSIDGVVENRSPEAHAANNRDTAHAAALIDRVGVRATADLMRAQSLHSRRLIAAWWSFGLHPMTHATPSEFFDPDLPGNISTRVERRLSLADGQLRSRPFVLGFGNGANGDVVLTGVGRHPCDSRTPWWVRRTASVPEMRDRAAEKACVLARSGLHDAGVKQISDVLTRQLESPTRSQVGSSQAVATAALLVPLRGAGADTALCRTPSQGLPAIGGAEGARTRYHRGHVLGVIALRAREGDRRQPRGCHEHKRNAPAFIRPFLSARANEYPAHALLTAVRIGDHLIIAIPFEPTVAAHAAVRGSVLDAVRPLGIANVVVAGLANSYAGYLTTPREYALQHYEGASTIYGPNSIEAVQRASVKVALAALGHGRRADYPTTIELRRGEPRRQP